MVASADGSDSAPDGFVISVEDVHQCAPDFEGTSALKEFDFKKKVGRNEQAPVRSVFLLTDGSANRGVVNATQVVNAARGISKVRTFARGGQIKTS